MLLPPSSILHVQKKSGFTLLEASIVLAIIALLAGGILASQTFINNARLNSLMIDSRYYIGAFNDFKNQYKSVPGDFSSASTWWPDFKNSTGANVGLGADDGDGNGLIRAATPPNNGEVFVAFEHLALAGLITGSYTGATTGAPSTTIATIGTNIPKTPMSGAGHLFNHPDATDGNVIGDAVYFDGKYGHVLIVAGATANALPSTGFLTPLQALQIDDKYDDGAPGKGWITSYKPSNATSTTDCASTNVATTAVYNTTLSTQACYLILNMLSN